MKFGLHYLLSCADGESPTALYRETIEQAVCAESFGFESVWPVEYHLNREVSVLPSPALLLAAIAERTRTAHVNPLPKLRDLVPRYREARAAAGHVSTANDLTLLMPMYVAESRRAVEADVARSVDQFARTSATVVATWVARAPAAERPALEALLARAHALSYETVNAVSGIFDTPDACVGRLRRLREELRPARVICWFNFGGLVPHERVMRSVALFAERVMPDV